MKKSRYQQSFSKSSIVRRRKQPSQVGIPFLGKSSQFIRIISSLLLSNKTTKMVNISKPLKITLKKAFLRRKRFVKCVCGVLCPDLCSLNFFTICQTYVDE